MRPRDTHPDLYQFYIGLFRELSPEQRGAMTAVMSDEGRQIAREGIRRRHPEYSDEEIARALMALLYGEQAATAIWPRR